MAKKKVTKKKSVGRPPKYNEEKKLAMELLYKNGCTDKQVASAIGVDEHTVKKWKTHDEKKDFFKKTVGWKEEADEKVELSLFNSAIGGKVEEVRPITVRDENGADSVEFHPFERYIAPSVQAQRFWLTNRRSSQWREKREHDINMVKQLSDEEVRARALEIIGKTEE